MTSEKPPNPKLSDEQLDRMLRNVVVPGDLRSKLLEIPNFEMADEDCKTRVEVENSRYPILQLALAASLLFVALFFGMQWLQRSKPGPELVGKTEPAASHLAGSDVANATLKTEAASQVSRVLASLDANTNFLESQFLEMEVARLRSELNKIDVSSPVTLNQGEIESIIAALTGEIVIPLGGVVETTRAEMVNVIKKYPGSRGADLASQYLERLETN